MSAADIDDGVLDELRKVDVKSPFSILLGAGASAGAGLPDWNELACRLMVSSGAVKEVETARAFLAAQDPQLAAEAAQASAADWETVLLDALYGDRSKPLFPGRLHTAAADLALSLRAGHVKLLTLNFDMLLEQALDELADDYGKTIDLFTRTSASPRGRLDEYVVHHLHGALDAARNEARNVVLTLSQFNELMLAGSSWQQAELNLARQDGPIILAGTSYRDSDIRTWLHGLQSTSGHGVIVFIAREGLGLSREQFDNVKPALVRQWSAIGVSPVITQDYSDAAQALTELPYLRNPDYLTPQERASDAWNKCLVDFARLQTEHSDILDVQRRELHRRVGKTANLVLWLTNGRGEAIRWAGTDRIYKDPDALRHVPTGHDSPWFIGQCMGRNDVITEDLKEIADGIKSWRYVMAYPVPIVHPAGPPFTFAGITAALPDRPEQADMDSWNEALLDVTSEWSNILTAIAFS